MSFLARHFSLSEFACKSGVEYPEELVDSTLNPLCEVLDLIRDAWGGPLAVISGYRTEAFNQALYDASAARHGGVSQVAKDSRHVHGDAADIAPSNPTPERCAQLHDLILRLRTGDQVMQAMGGLGIYKHWVHVDIRPHAIGHLAQWAGDGLGSAPVEPPVASIAPQAPDPAV